MSSFLDRKKKLFLDLHIALQEFIRKKILNSGLKWLKIKFVIILLQQDVSDWNRLYKVVIKRYEIVFSCDKLAISVRNEHTTIHNRLGSSKLKSLTSKTDKSIYWYIYWKNILYKQTKNDRIYLMLNSGVIGIWNRLNSLCFRRNSGDFSNRKIRRKHRIQTISNPC